MLRPILFFILLFCAIGSLSAQCYVDRHNTSRDANWVSCQTSPNPNGTSGNTHWILYDLGYDYPLFQLRYWNYNHPDNIDYGLRDVLIQTSDDGVTFHDFGTFTFDQGTGSSIYEGVLGPNFFGVSARYVLLTPLSNWGGSCFGFGEMRVGLAPENLTPVYLESKAFLSGNFNSGQGLMTDQLRQKGLIPTTEPYQNIASFVHVGYRPVESVTDASVFDQPNDADDIVDWVFVELRDDVDPTIVVSTRSALLQRDGDIVDVDGSSPVSFYVEPDKYHVTIRHRNHIGIKTASSRIFAEGASTIVDFTSDSNAIEGQNTMDFGGVQAMYGGNVNAESVLAAASKYTRMTGPTSINDYLSLLQSIGGTYTSFEFNVYSNADINMDGNIRMTGPTAINDYLRLLQILEGNYTNFVVQTY